MYEEYFGLTKKPFSIVPDPRYVYMSTGHREALAHLLYGIKSDGGFVLLTGEVGTGKTTVCRRLLQMVPEDTEVAFILNPKLTVEELLESICDEFGINYPEGNKSIKVFVTLINNYLLDVHSRDRRAVLIIEEAQNLKQEVLEQVRLLTNLETNDHKLLQMIMLGQPELRDMLSQKGLRQLSQRITARYHLGPLTQEEVPEYVNFRLSAAGLVRGQLFPRPIFRRLYRLSKGVPRLINVLCDRALLGAYTQGKERVDTKTLITAAREVTGEGEKQQRRQKFYQWVLAGLVLVLCAILGTTYYKQLLRPLPPSNLESVTQKPASKPKAEIVRTVTLERPVDQTAFSTKEAAYQALFKEWRLQYVNGYGRPVCEQALAQGLRCLESKSSVGILRQMNKPAVLKLVDENKGEYYATLTSFKGETATFAIGSETRTVDMKEIIRWWSGDYLILWRAPAEYKEDLKPGSSGPMVEWLEKQPALGQKRESARAGLHHKYEGKIVNQVKKFQLAIGMVPDGIVGPRTIMLLNAPSNGTDPVLNDGKESN
ncbi:MAG: peptidoglycan-binding protein [Syntrophus sp. (in: bacteria)]|nr:peptidoglycan-binding protein [Syntrophus sp. (in: bacteria)]MBA4418990.1 peptidoglycan-binding protein [Syntrophus sp. (in: bacteria)]